MARMTRAELERGPNHAGQDCPSSDTIAAYYAHLLPADEQAQWDVHVAGCSRCQTVLAALVRSEPSTNEQGAGQAWVPWKWLVPVAAAGTAFAIWISVEPIEHTMPATVEETAARTDTPLSLPKSTMGPAVGKEQEPELNRSSPVGQKKVAAPAVQRQPEASATSPTLGEAKTTVTPTPASAALKNEATSDVDRLEKDKQDQTAVADGAVAGRARQTAASPAAKPAPPPPMLEARDKMRATSARDESVTPMERGVTSILVLPSPSGSAVLWRIEPDGHISKSMDKGITWTRQLLPSTGALVAGSTPSAEVCWAVGRDGLILRTIDGAHWLRVEPPVTATFVSVTAEDALIASVTAADGRQYRTVDGGQTWRAL